MTPRRLFWAIFLTDAGLVAILLIALLLPSEARLTLDANTQIFEVNVASGFGFDGWGQFEPSSLFVGTRRCETPSLEMLPQLRGPFKMTAKSDQDGGLTIVFQGEGAIHLGPLTCNGNPQALSDYQVLHWTPEKARTLALQFAGTLKAGDAASNMVDPRILLSGKILAQGSSALFHGTMVTSETSLFTGDEVLLPGRSSHNGIAYGLLHVKDGAIHVIAHAVAPDATLIHIGQQYASSTESVAPSFYLKLQAQYQWAVLLIVMGIAAHMLSALHNYRSELQSERLTDEVADAA